MTVPCIGSMRLSRRQQLPLSELDSSRVETATCTGRCLAFECAISRALRRSPSRPCHATTPASPPRITHGLQLSNSGSPSRPPPQPRPLGRSKKGPATALFFPRPGTWGIHWACLTRCLSLLLFVFLSCLWALLFGRKTGRENLFIYFRSSSHFFSSL